MIVAVKDFDEWRAACRGLLANETPPADVQFTEADGLFAGEAVAAAPSKHRVPKHFLELAERVACHRDPHKWLRLYAALWRLTHGEPHLFELATDDDVHWLQRAEKQVRRDAHKMKAFVRFKEVDSHFIAWHRPDHRIVRLTAPFFSRRFPSMIWTILTPDESVTWNLKALQYGPGVPASEAPPPDTLEALWKTYYRSTFNPARIKLDMMTREMPVRHWRTLPETQQIPAILAEAPERVATMIRRSEGFAQTAAAFLPEHRDVESLRAAARNCTACTLCGPATQTVFGEGPANAKIVLVGEQPGDQEDRAGRPFVGPAGVLLDEAMQAAGLDRETVYRTNAVKHFKFVIRGDRREHHRASPAEMAACKPWLAAELDAIKPAVIVCLGVTATQAVLGRMFRHAERRGEVVSTDGGRAISTWHPAAILRGPSPERAAAMKSELIDHLTTAHELGSRA